MEVDLQRLLFIITGFVMYQTCYMTLLLEVNNKIYRHVRDDASSVVINDKYLDIYAKS